MLEAVNSVLQTAPLVRNNAEQTSTADSFAANPERVQRTVPQAPYISPYIHLDVNYDKAVILLRNGETGDVEGQYPSEASLQEAARQAAKRQVAVEQAPQPAPEAKQSAPAPQPQQQSAPQPAPETNTAAITAQQQAAFQAAAQSGNTNAGNITLFA